MRVAALTAVAIAVVLGAGTAIAQDGPQHVPDPAITDGSAQRELDAAKAAWRSSGVTRYRFRLRTSCFCPESVTRPRTFEVRGGKVVRPRRGTKDELATIPRLHRVVQDAIDDEAAVLDVRYDQRGVPRRIAVDRQLMLADEEIAHAVLRFERLRRR